MNQTEIANHLDLSERALRDVLKRLELDHKKHSLDDIRTGYIRDLREKAAGREMTPTKQSLDQVKARELLASAQLKELTLFKEHKLVLDREKTTEKIAEWVQLATAEFENAIDKIITIAEDQSGEQVDRERIDPIVDASRRVIGDFGIKPG